MAIDWSNMGTAGYAGAIGAGIGTLTSVMAIDAKNKALEKQAEFNNKMMEAKDELLRFAQMNNTTRANEVISSYMQDIAVAKGEAKVQAEQKMSTLSNAILSGIAGGVTQARKVQTAYRDVATSLSKIDIKGDQAITNIMEKARDDNSALQSEKINNYNSTVLKNTQLAGQAITGMNAALMVAGSGVSGFQTGFSLGGTMDKMDLQRKSLDEQLKLSENSLLTK